MTEVWKPVLGFPLYEVSSLGAVRSIGRIDSRGSHRKQKLLKLKLSRSPSASPYLCIGLYKNGERIQRRVHHLVLEAFVGPKPAPDLQGAHSDGNKYNNSATNLAWKTCWQNHQDKKRHGTTRTGERHPAARLNNQGVSALRADRADGMSYRQLAQKYGVSRTTANRVARIITYGAL